MAIPLLLAPVLAMLAKKGLTLVGEAVMAKGKDWVEKKAGVKLEEEIPPEKLLELKKWQTENETVLEKIAQENLTDRHQADMQSDSWLSKNVRPLCLLILTLTIAIGMFVPAEYVASDKYQFLTDMSQWVYGYYFVGRSTFDKGNIQFIKK